jgi:hypothetical protein
MNHARTPLALLASFAFGGLALGGCGNLTPQTTDTNAESGTGSEATATAGESDDSDTPTGGGIETVTVFDLQKGEVTPDKLVSLKDVIVTSPIFYDKDNNGNFFIAEAAGGAFSGIQVYAYADVMAELDAEGKLPAVGAVIDIRAMYKEFFDYSELTLGAPGDLTITGAGTVPPPATVTAAEIATGGAKAEDYEGCLVQIEGAKVSKPVEMYGEFEVDGVLKVDDLIFLPSPAPKPPVDTTFTKLVGQVTYSFEEFKLAPRSCADYQGWDCTEPVDPTDTTTGENVAATIYEIQMGMHPDKTYVDVKDVVVTSPFFKDKNGNGNVFIAEAAGGEYSGIQVYIYADVTLELEAADKVPKLGDVLTISGQYTEFYDYSEITLSKADNLTITGTGTVPDPAVVAPADIATGGSKAEAYEGVLVQVQDVTVTAPVVEFGEFTVTGDLVVDDLFFLPEPGPSPAMDQAYTSITGLLAYSFEVFKLSPRSLDDLVAP